MSVAKVVVKNPIVEMDGDEMARVVWSMIKEKLLKPQIEIPIKYFDLHIKSRDDSDDAITIEAALAVKEHKVGVKCATITANADRVKEYTLKSAWPSPNATIRSVLDGTVFRKPIIVKNIPPSVGAWTRPITIARHAYGDIYSAVEFVVPGAGKVELVYTPESGEPTVLKVQEFHSPGVVMAMHNLDKSIRSFAKACVNYALSEKINIWFGAKDTISKKYHGQFRKIFQETVDSRKDELTASGIDYRYMLIDDAAAQLMKNPGGFLLALMNYDGDVWSDMIAGGFGSLGLMTSVLVSPEGNYEYEAAHGTVTRHFYAHQRGEKTSTNSVASIFAWTGAIRKRGELDSSPDVIAFADKLEQKTVETIEQGTMTKDLALIIGSSKYVGTEEFIDAVAARL